jgi:putative transposase
MLEYKCAWYGKKLVIVNPYKTSQICSECGYDDGKHTLDIRDWTCPGCGHHHDRDINAAKNILRLGTSLGKRVVTSA